MLSHLKSAEMSEVNRQMCLDKTRLDIIKFIMDWIADDSSDRKRILWLYGLAGSGKSTLATTIAWMMRDLDRLGAFFFFARNIPERNAATLIRTLAYQLALFDVGIGAVISRIAESIPRIAEMPLDFQFANLLSEKALGSVEWSRGPIVLVIDAFDECEGETDRKILLQALSKGFSDLPSFIRVILVSRQEPDIDRTLKSHPAVYSCSLDIDSMTNREDVLEFVRHRLNQIRMENEYLPLDWPGDDSICALTDRAAGLFVWASTACLYTESHSPDRRLNELITQTSVESSSEPFANLDSLYKTGIQSAGRWTDPSFRLDCCHIFGAILCARTPLSCSTINSLLPLSQPCLRTISRLGCVLRVSETEGIRTLHPSFHDYLSKRCNTEPWSINIELHHEMLARHCIKLLDNTLQENICGLTLLYPVQEETLPEAVSYACKFWVEHICLISHAADSIGELAELVYGFMSRHLLHWMEALSVLKSHSNTIRSLQNLLEWLQVCHPTQLLDACN